MKTREELLKNGHILDADSMIYSERLVKAILAASTEEQMKCKFCHEPFLDLSGKTEDEFDQFDPDGAYCGLDKDGTITYGSPGDGFDGQNRDVKINFCPMCGRKLGDE